MYQVLSLVLSRLVFRSSTCFSVVLLRFSVIPFYYYYTFKLVVKDACAFASNMLMVQIDRFFFLSGGMLHIFFAFVCLCDIAKE